MDVSAAYNCNELFVCSERFVLHKAGVCPFSIKTIQHYISLKPLKYNPIHLHLRDAVFGQT